MARDDFDRINAATGYANGDRFTTAEQVRDYFTPEAQWEMFGPDAVTDPATLAEWAELVIRNRWHMGPAPATVSRDELREAVRTAYRNADRRGQHWHYVRVYPDGRIVAGVEVSVCVPESEYYGRAPHPVTVWSEQSHYSSTPADGVYEWEECEHAADADFYADDEGRKWCWPSERDGNPTCTRPMRFGDFCDQCDFTTDYRDAEAAVERCGWLELSDE